MAIQHQTGGQRKTTSSFFLGFYLGADAMTQEESFRFGNHRSAKKHKQNKIPQRGLGVAQLEKIRLEEQQKSFSNPHAFPAINLQPRPNSSSVAYKHSQDPIFPIPDLHPKTPSPFSNPPVLPLSWSHHETFFTNMESFSLPLPALYEPNASRKQQSLVNVSPPSSGVNLQMEPPSNQIYTNTKSTWAEEDRMVGIKRPWSLLNDSPSNSSVEKHNHLEYGNPVFRDTGLNSSLHRRNWKPLPEADFRAKDNGSLGAFLTLGLTSSSSSISRSTKSSLLTTERGDGHECQMRLPKDNVGGSTIRDSMSNSRFGSDETWSGSAGHHQHPFRHHFYPNLHYQAGAQLYSLVCPEASRGKSELEDKRDSGQTERKACIDLNLKL